MRIVEIGKVLERCETCETCLVHHGICVDRLTVRTDGGHFRNRMPVRNILKASEGGPSRSRARAGTAVSSW
jgi:hypothetical protein